mmetsp:Transcript_2658/g.4736  ORF Transcript_2658/g.4736 Transcript_2658/m.4736 type:complete len:86 (+) Transcript_2658:454-711(+)
MQAPYAVVAFIAGGRFDRDYFKGWATKAAIRSHDWEFSIAGVAPKQACSSWQEALSNAMAGAEPQLRVCHDAGRPKSEYSHPCTG